MQRVVITGAGVKSPLADNLESYHQALFEGKTSFKKITAFDTANYTSKMAAFFDKIPQPKSVDEKELLLMSDFTKLVLAASEDAFTQSGLIIHEDLSQRAGLSLGSGFINLYDLENVYSTFFLQGARKLSPTTIPVQMGGAAAARLSMQFGLKGESSTQAAACASGLCAIHDAVRKIRNGYADVMLAGGADLLAKESLFACWDKMRILSPEAEDADKVLMPFDKTRRGLALGEGAAMFVLESYEHAKKRGAIILGEVSGSAVNSDAFHLVKPSIDGEVACLKKSLEDAQIEPKRIGVIFAHGTATRLNDECEAKSLAAVFSEDLKNIPLTANKAFIGHTMGASGAFSLAQAIASLNQGMIFPVQNFEEADAGTKLNILKKGAITGQISHVLIEAFAFGGVNSALIFSRVEANLA